MRPKDFAIAETDELINAKDYLFEQKPFPLKILSEKIQKLLSKTAWINGSDLVEDLKSITGSKSLREIEKVLANWKVELSEKPTESTVPQKEQLEKLEEEAEKLKIGARESAQKAQTKQEKWLKLQKEKVSQTISKEEQEKVVSELKGKVVYATPQKPEPEIKLAEQELAFAKLAKQNPQIFEQKLAEDIIKKNPGIFTSNDVKPLADIIATDTTNVFINPSQKPIPTGVFAALTNYKESSEIQKTGVVYTLLSEEKQNLYREILNRTVGVNLTNKVLGFPETTYELSQTPPQKPDGSFSLKLDDLQANSFSLQESSLSNVFDNPVLSEAKNTVSLQLKETALTKIASLPKEGFLGKLSQFTTSRSFDSIAPFLGLPTQMTYTGTTFFGKMITTFLPEYAPLITNFSAKLGIDIGIKALAPVTEKAIETGVVAAGGTAVKGGLGGVISGWLASVGVTASVPLLNVLVFIGGLLITLAKPILNWIKRHQEDLKIVGLLMLGGGALVNSIPLLVFGGLIFTPIALRSGFSVAGVAARNAFFFGRIGASMAIIIATPVIVALIVFPILVAIILFIINSGAYLVPPSGSLIGLENPYVGIEKKASPEGPFQNGDIPIKVDYTITVSAKKGLLTDIKIEDDCKVIKNGAAPNCPKPSRPLPKSDDPDYPQTISPSKSYAFEYSITFGSHDYNDSAVVNTFTVTANSVDEEKSVTSANSATIIIGKPPMECPNDAWPLANDEGLYAVTQGAMTPPGWTHNNTPNAIDIGVNGATIVAMHSGIVSIGESSCGGKWVRVASSCGSPFGSYYGHLGAITVSDGQKVTIGQAMGISDNTGSCSTGAHLHFQFFNTGSAPITKKPYLRRDVPIGCTNQPGNSCN